MSITKYLWFPMPFLGISLGFIRVTIAYDKYITDVERISINADKIISKWNYKDNIEKRMCTDIPTYNMRDLGYKCMRYNADVEAQIYENDTVTINRVRSDRSQYPLLKGLRKDDWYAFLNGESIAEIEAIVSRRQFLESKIIEKLDNPTYVDHPDNYFILLEVFEVLYNMGYEAYGGFKDYISTNTISHPTNGRTVKNPIHGSFTIDINGNVNNITYVMDSKEISRLRKWGLNVN